MNKRVFMCVLAQACNKLGIERDDVIISHGGASLAMELRCSTDDIDVSVSQRNWDVLISKGYEIKHLPAKGDIGAVNIIEAMGVDWHLRKVDDKVETYNRKGFRITTAVQLLKDRIDLGRPKDLDDIRKLETYYDELPDVYKERLYKLL